MFYTKAEVRKIKQAHEDEIRSKDQHIEDLNRTFLRSQEKKDVEHELALKEKDFQLKHISDDRVVALQAQVEELTKQKAVLEQKVEMLDKIVDLSGDVLDVKALVSDLIKKLPNIDLKELSVNVQGNNGQVS